MFIDARAGKHAEDAGWARGAGTKALPPGSLCTEVRHREPAAQSIATQALTCAQTRGAEGCCETNTRGVRFSRDVTWKGTCEPATAPSFREDLKAGRSRMMESTWSFPTQWEGRRMEIKTDCTGFWVYWQPGAPRALANSPLFFLFLCSSPCCPKTCPPTSADRTGLQLKQGACLEMNAVF